MFQPRAYMPIHALQKINIDSMLSIALQLLDNDVTRRRYDYHHGRRTMLFFLLSIKSADNNEKILTLIDQCYRKKLDWSSVESLYSSLQKSIEPYKSKYRADDLDKYWELHLKNYRTDPANALRYISKYRENGFQPEELKLYWNYEQIHQLDQQNFFNPDTDADVHSNLLSNPVCIRQNAGKISFHRTGIEKAVFNVPTDKQIIVLDFADERMPGGYFLENARTQEEVRHAQSLLSM
jgi:hypothetical protein